MNTILLFCGFLALTTSLPIDEGVSLVQDNVGNYKLNYKTADSTREEQGFDDGKIVGSYSFLDINGTSHAIKYTADPERGFVVEGNVPEQVAETPEVAAARAYHLAIVEQTRALLPELPEEETEGEVYVKPAVKPQLLKEKTIKLIAPKNIKISQGDLEKLTAAIKSARASNTPLESIKVVPSSKSLHFKPQRKPVVDNTAEIEAAKAELFAAHQAAIANLANEYRKIALYKKKQDAQ